MFAPKISKTGGGPSYSPKRAPPLNRAVRIGVRGDGRADREDALRQIVHPPWNFTAIPTCARDRDDRGSRIEKPPSVLLPTQYGVLQPKVAIGAIGDPHEQEADRVADQVLRMPEPQPMDACETPDPGGTCTACGKKSRWTAKPSALQISAKSKESGVNTGTVPATVDDALRSPGETLDKRNRSFFEPRFGYDFSNVRVHTGPVAEQSARDIGALAYAVGNHIVFGADQSSMHTYEGRRLLGHELTHVIQQSRPSTGGAVTLSARPTSGPLQRQAAPSGTAPAPRLPTKIGFPGQTLISREVQAYRAQHPDLPSNINLVAVEYVAPGATEAQTKIFENRPGVAHSEQVMDQFFDDLRKTNGKDVTVRKIYSERQFCGPGDQDCEGLMLRSARYKNAEKTFGYDYQDAAPRGQGEGPYRASQTKTQLQESHERISTTKNLEWDFQRRPTQPYYKRLQGPAGPVPEGPSGLAKPLRPPGAGAAATGGSEARSMLDSLAGDLRMMRAAKVLNGVLRVVEFAGTALSVYQSLSMAKNAQAGAGLIMTDRIAEAEQLRDTTLATAADYTPYSEWVQSLGWSFYALGAKPGQIKDIIGDISDLGSDISSQNVDLSKQSVRVKYALKEVSAKRQQIDAILADPVKIAAFDHGGSTLGAATLFAAGQDFSRIESALMQVDEACDRLLAMMTSDIDFLVKWQSFLESAGVDAGTLNPTPTIVVGADTLKDAATH